MFADQAPHAVEMLSGREVDWDACYSVLESHSGDVTVVVFSPDGQLVASISDEETVRVWVTTEGCRSKLQGPSPYINQLAFSSDG
jgi:WD40 repeat protein